jgi:hypothetical protein
MRDGLAPFVLAVIGLGISGFFFLKSAKTPNNPKLNHTVALNVSKITRNEGFEAEIIGDYLAHGFGGTALRLADGNVLKVISLERTLPDEFANLNKHQADFFEALYDGDLDYTDAIVDVKHFNKGRAGPKMTSLVNQETKDDAMILSIGEKIAYWVMEYVPNIGQGEMSDPYIDGSERKIKEWGEENGWEIQDFKESNYGSREDGSFVMFDPWVKPL